MDLDDKADFPTREFLGIVLAGSGNESEILLYRSSDDTDVSSGCRR